MNMGAKELLDEACKGRQVHNYNLEDPFTKEFEKLHGAPSGLLTSAFAPFGR